MTQQSWEAVGWGLFVVHCPVGAALWHGKTDSPVPEIARLGGLVSAIPEMAGLAHCLAVLGDPVCGMLRLGAGLWYARAKGHLATCCFSTYFCIYEISQAAVLPLPTTVLPWEQV